MESQDIKGLIQKAIAQGWTVERGEGGILFIPPAGRLFVKDVGLGLQGDGSRP